MKAAYCRYMNEDMQESINKLEDLVDYCYQYLNVLQFSGQHQRKKKVLLPLYLNACDLAGSVACLLQQERVNSANVLLRTLKESGINARFIYATGSLLWVDSYLLEGENEGNYLVKEIESLRERYPHMNFASDVFTPASMNEIRRKVTSFRNYFQRKYTALPVIPGVNKTNLLRKNYSIKDRTKILDYYSMNRDSSGGLKFSDEWDYTLLYSHLSGSTHTSTSFLGTNLIGRNDQGVTISRHGKLQGIQLVSLTTFAALLDLTILFQSVFDCNDPDNIAVFKSLAHELKQKLPDR